MAAQPVVPQVRVQAEAFDPAAETARLTSGRRDIGAVVSFVGLCRDEDGRLSGLELEHYPGMAEAEMTRVAAEACARWPLLGLTVVHRHGIVRPGDDIVLVIATASHRRDAFMGADFMMDYLKTRAPFWKREHLTDGTLGAWVEAKTDDAAAAARWSGERRGR